MSSSISGTEFINGKTWFKYINHQPDVNYGCPGLLHYANFNGGDAVCIGWDIMFNQKYATSLRRGKDGEFKPVKRFAEFDSILSAAKFIHKKQGLARCFYEYVFGYNRSRMYFDIDYKTTDPNIQEVEAQVIYAATQSISIALEDYGFPLENQRIENWYLFSSSREGKVSLHIVLPFLMDDNYGRKEFAGHVNAYAVQFGYKALTDSAVYSSTQAFRVYGCHKAAVGATPKSFLSPWYWDRNQEVVTELIDYDEDNGVDFDLWLTRTSMANYIYSSFQTIVAKRIRVQKTYESVSYSEEQLDKIVEMVLRADPGLKLRDVTDAGIINFSRCRPTNCRVCNCTHDNDGKWAKRDGSKVYLHCRRYRDHGATTDKELVGGMY